MSKSEQERWNNSAEEYSILAPNVPFYRDTSARIVQSLPHLESPILADVGCGSNGLLQTHLLEKYSHFKKLYCVDISECMINVLKRKFSDLRFEFVTSSAENFRHCITEPVDLILVNSAIWLFDVPQAVSQFRNLMSRRGRFIFTIAEWDLVDIGEPNIAKRYELVSLELQHRGLPSKPARGLRRKYSLQELHSLFSDQGLKVSSVEDHSSIMSSNDWISFYSIKAIAMRSLPELPLDLATDVLTSAMKKFSEVICVDWKLFQIEHDR